VVTVLRKKRSTNSTLRLLLFSLFCQLPPKHFHFLQHFPLLVCLGYLGKAMAIVREFAVLC